MSSVKVVSKFTVLFIVAAATFCGCAQAPSVEVNAPPAGPQPLLPEAYSGHPAGPAPMIAQSGAVTSAQPPTYAAVLAPAGERQTTKSPRTLLDPYRPHWVIDVQ